LASGSPTANLPRDISGLIVPKASKTAPGVIT
jgi:hypothetical protein